MSGRRPQVGDKVVYLPHPGNDPDSAWATMRATVPGIVVEPSATRSSAPLDGCIVWHPSDHDYYCCQPERLRVVEAATYEPVYDFRSGQVWRDAGGVEFFRTNDSFVAVNGEFYSDTHPIRPLTLIFDPSAVTE